MTTLIAKARELLARSAPADPAAAPAPAKKKVVREYHAVSIAPGPRCCEPARALQDQRFISRNAPVLPLRDCTRPDCTCRYQHYDDRRAGLRRTRDLGVAIDGWVDADRRDATKARGRRKTENT